MHAADGPAERGVLQCCYTRRPAPLLHCYTTLTNRVSTTKLCGFENRCGLFGPPRVRIPPPPLHRPYFSLCAGVFDVEARRNESRSTGQRGPSEAFVDKVSVPPRSPERTLGRSCDSASAPRWTGLSGIRQRGRSGARPGCYAGRSTATEGVIGVGAHEDHEGQLRIADGRGSSSIGKRRVRAAPVRRSS
jgi:hypothetical protein